MKYVIIGGVAGGATAAARLRRVDEMSEIILLEKGKYISYANCGLPYYIGGVIEEREKLLVQTPESFGKRFRISADVPHGDGRINAYLRGEEIACDCAPGWCAVTYGGYPVGLGKASDGVVKNKYPKSLRRRF